MADSTTHLVQIEANQAAKETTANELFDAHSPASLFGRNGDTTSVLTWGMYGGKYRKADGTIITKANSTVSLTASATNYIKETDGTVSVTTSAPTDWPGPLASNAKALYEVVCGSSGVTSYTDYRTNGIGNGTSGSGGASAAEDVSITDTGGYYTGTDVEAALQELGAAVAGAGTGDGDVAGPASAVNNHVVFFDGTSGKLIKDSGLTLAGTNTGDQTSVTGNAGTATALQTARTIGGVSFDGTANITQPFDVHAFYPGVPSASAIVLRVPIARAVTFAANFSGSYAKSAVAATASTAIDIQKNGSSVGTITFAASGSSATFTSSGGSSVSFSAGDVLGIITPSSADATLADIGIVLAGTR